MPPLDQAFWDSEAQALMDVMQPWLEEATLSGTQEGFDLLAQPGLATDWELINNHARAWAVARTASTVAEITTTSMEAFAAAFPAWVASGEHLDSLIETLSQSYQPWRARLIAMTETTRAYAQGNRTMWGASGVTDGMEWRTGQDDIVCLICRPLAGKKTTLDGTFPGGRDVPPAHPGCRCHIYPVIGSITNDEAREYRASGQMSQAELDQVISDFEAGKHLDLQKTNFDAKLAYIAKVRGFDALPEVISDPNLFEAVLKEKEMRPLYRGVVKTETLAVEDMLAAFKHGDCYYGRGLVGNGVYFSPNLDIAKVYAEGDLTAIIQVGLRKEARLISWQDLVYEYDAAGKEILESFGKAYFDRWSAAFEDISTFAVVRGYDGILASTIESHHILLNRTALIVQG